jgi:hypothetical protein
VSGKQYKPGDTWTCECGRKHELTDGYLAAHWNDLLEHKCECGRKHTVQCGFVSLVKQKRRKQDT